LLRDDNLLFIPSEDVKKKGTVINSRGDQRYRITTNILNPKNSKWAKNIISKQELVEAILKKFDEMERYLK
jgi:hypothetical protein